MLDHPHAHDLLWLDSASAIEDINPGREGCAWQPRLPVVVRRDWDASGRIPVGIRGKHRGERLAGWVKPEHVMRKVTPEELTLSHTLNGSLFRAHPAIEAALQLCRMAWTWHWGITGSVAYAVATGEPVLHAHSDLDVRLWCHERPDREELIRWHAMQTMLSCRMDTQIEVAQGAFSLSEWIKGGAVLLKTKSGPRLIHDPWKKEALS